MNNRRWFNQGQPQLLQIATFLLYATAVFSLLQGVDPTVLVTFGNTPLGFELLRLFVVVGAVAAGFGIANEQRWGWYLGIAVAALPLIGYAYVMFRFSVSPFRFDLVGLLFDIALMATLVHPISRSYQRIWFN